MTTGCHDRVKHVYYVRRACVRGTAFGAAMAAFSQICKSLIAN